MQAYLKEFYSKLKKYRSSLVKVSTAKKLDNNAKEYLVKLAKQAVIEKVAWGWYYIPEKYSFSESRRSRASPKITPKKDVAALEFLHQDQNFKIVVSQSAASFWNQDFVHRETLNIVVDDRPLKKVLETFAKKKGWQFSVEYNKDAHKLKYEKIKKLSVEGPNEVIIECVKNWAFVDAIAVLVVNKNKINWHKLSKKSYWTRISGTNVRVRQAIEYVAYQLNKKTDSRFDAKKITINNNFVRQELDEAVEKVLEFE